MSSSWNRPAVLLASLLCTLAAASAGEQGRPRAVVELFTSQGCSSCPPADRVLAGLADRGDVVALSYHVDYWDYLGWKDTLARPANTERQKLYAKGRDGGSLASSVYTPEAVVNGRRHLVGSDKTAISGAIAALVSKGQGLTVPVEIARRGDSLVIEAGASGTTEADVVLVSFIPDESVPIRGGENRGSSIRYVNTVTRIQTIGMYHGKAARYEMPADDPALRGKGMAVLLQQSENGVPGTILGAAIAE